MKKYLLLSTGFIFSFVFSIGVAQAAIGRVQTNTGSNNGSTNVVSATWGSATTTGNLLVAIVGFNSGSGSVVTPPAGLGWTSAIGVRSTNGTDDITTQIFYIPNAPSQSGASSWTITSQPAGGFATLTLVEYSGVDPSNPLHTTGYGAGNGALGDTGTTTPNYNAGEVAVAGITTASGNTNFSGETNSFTEESEIASILTAMAPGINTAFEDRMPTLNSGNSGVQATINGTYTVPTWAWAAVIATFNPAPAAGGTDMCVNIAGDQATVPNGYTVDASGNCVPSENMCTDAAGNQVPVPSGYTVDAAGNCVPGENMCMDAAGNQVPCDNGGTDMCVNMAGDQATVPNGYVSDVSGNCVPEADATDLCVNIMGDQFTIPDGYVIDAAGDCVVSDAAGHGLAPFTDTSNSWAGIYIQQLYARGVVSGRTSTTFGTDENLTRAEMVKIAELTFGYAIREGGMPSFSDVHATDWFAKYIAAAEEAGIVGGYADGTFHPNAPVTRAESLKILLEAAAKSYHAQTDIFDRWGNVSFTDVDQAAWYAKYVNFAFANVIVSGKTSIMFAPNDNVTRGEMSKMAILALENFMDALRHQGRGPQAAQADLRVQIVAQTAPGVYAPLMAPTNTVYSVTPGTSTYNALITCPKILFGYGLGLPGILDCSEYNLPSATHIALIATPITIIPNATFYQWTDIQPFVLTNSLAISNACTYTSFASATTPSLDCAMKFNGAAVSREIQAVYKCNDTFVYDPVSMKCEKPKPVGQTPCFKYAVNVTKCGLGLQVKRTNHGPNNYTVTVTPALTPSVNTLPSNSSSCKNMGGSGSPLFTNCGYYYNAYPTAVTLTATSSGGSLPSGFSWSGACSGSSATCTVSVTQIPTYVVANFPQ